ncbi:MAG: hypothetical protein JWQ38_3507 [Flavipsychrobacter sp.]|nr:hypothetical protein [Flavipsychrobacter sp.]
MKFILQIILIAILSAAVEFILPWWSVAVVAFIVTLVMGGKGGRGFLAGFLGVGLCWLVVALCHDVANEHILSARMAVLFKLPNYGMFMVVTVFIGGLIGGLAGWAGALLKPVKGR